MGLFDAHLGPSHLGRVARNEVVRSLGRGESGDGREDTKGIAGQENHVLRVTAFRIGRAVVNELNGVGPTGVLGLRRVVEVGHSFCVENDVLEHRSKAACGGENGGFVFFRQVDEFGIAATLEIEHPVGAPSVLVVADQGALRVSGKRGFPRTGQAEENGGVLAVGVGRAVHGQNTLLGENEVHHREDGFFDFTGVSRTANDDLLSSVVDDDEAVGVEAVRLTVCLEMRGVKHGKFRFVFLKLSCIRSDEHVAGEGVVPGVVVDHADWQSFGKVSTAVEVLHEQRFLVGKEVNDLGSHALEGGLVGGDVHVTPVDVA